MSANEIFNPKTAEELSDEFFNRVSPSTYHRLLKNFGERGITIKDDDERNLLIFRIKYELEKRDIETDDVKAIRSDWGNTTIGFRAVKGSRILNFMMRDDLGKRVVIRMTPPKKMKKIPKFRGHYDIQNMEVFEEFMTYLNK